MIEVKIQEKNDEALTFRLPSSLKEKLPGAYSEIDNGKEYIRFKDGNAIGQLMRDLVEMFVSGRIEKANTEIRALKEIVEHNAQELKDKNKTLNDTVNDFIACKEGAIELLKLMKEVKPTPKQMGVVDMSKIKKLQEVL